VDLYNHHSVDGYYYVISLFDGCDLVCDFNLILECFRLEPLKKFMSQNSHKFNSYQTDISSLSSIK